MGSCAACVGNGCSEGAFPLFYHGVLGEGSWSVNQHGGGAWRDKQQISSVLVVRNLPGKRGVGSWLGQVERSVFRVEDDCSWSEVLQASSSSAAQIKEGYLPQTGATTTQQVWGAFSLPRCTFEYFRLSPPALM